MVGDAERPAHCDGLAEAEVALQLDGHDGEARCGHRGRHGAAALDDHADGVEPVEEVVVDKELHAGARRVDLRDPLHVAAVVEGVGGADGLARGSAVLVLDVEGVAYVVARGASQDDVVGRRGHVDFDGVVARRVEGAEEQVGIFLAVAQVALAAGGVGEDEIPACGSVEVEVAALAVQHALDEGLYAAPAVGLAQTLVERPVLVDVPDVVVAVCCHVVSCFSVVYALRQPSSASHPFSFSHPPLP